MFLRKILLTLTLGVFTFSAFSATIAEPVSKTPISISAEQQQQVEALLKDFATQDLNQLTINKVEEMTGKEMSFKEKVAFKIAKMKMKKAQKKVTASMKSGNGLAAPDLDKGVYIILAIFIPFVAVGLATDWKGKDWIIALLLSCLCGLPGIIYALVKMNKYYA
ncbi:MAG: YqaE/Pmp3 family membrane protein [Chitinophagales bacterium]|nr:YqaE/Pmp3 family membrane protein [Chitinophagales bacterium]